MIRLPMTCLLWAVALCAYAQSCGTEPVQVQILGSGTGDLAGGRAAPATLVWVDGKSRVLIDTGPGAALHFTRAGADIADIDAILLTHLRAERSTDLAAVLQLPATPARTRVLPLYGPVGNRSMPSTVTFVRALFDSTRGAWRHLGDFLSPLARTSYKLEPHDLRQQPAKLGVGRTEREDPLLVFANERVRVKAVLLNSGPIPMMIWRVEARGKNLILASDTTAVSEIPERFAQDVDMLVTSLAIDTKEPALAIGHFAQGLKTKQLVLTATTGREDPLTSIRRRYAGSVIPANDLDCLTP